MKTIESAIAIIRNSGRILLTWDDDWDSWLLPNQTIHEPDTPEHAQGTLAIDYLPCMPFRYYRVPPTLIVDSYKPCPEHDCVINHYLIDMDDWEGETEFHRLDHFEFDVSGHDCTWWTLDEMLADPRMRAVNGDLLGTLELIETGLLPATSVAG